MRIRLSARYQWEDTNSPPFFDQTFTGPRITIGNSPNASLSLNGSVLSGEQIVIVLGETEPQIINQADGTSLNGETLGLNLSRPLKHGDVLALGAYKISVAFDDEPSLSNETAIESDVTSLAEDNSDAITLIEEASPDRNQRTSAPRSFEAILDSLRTDEDRFYFVIEGGTQSGSRIPVEIEEMPLGWDETGQHIRFDISSITDLCAFVHKDWSGVILRPQPGFGITVNGEPLENERRLRDGDRVFLNPPLRGVANNTQFVLTFHEPTSLVILDSVMPRVLREDITPPPTESGPVAEKRKRPVRKLAALVTSDREIVSVFTFVELSLMAVGTIVGAVIIFLILNFS